MRDVFISFSSEDRPLAEFVYNHLLAEGLSAFLAPVSLEPGNQWSPQILTELRSSDWVLFLASRAACNSPYVQQEVGAAISARKQLVPVVWDMPPSELPGWANQYQALVLAGKLREHVEADITAIAERIKARKNTGLLVVGLLVAGLMAFGK